MTQIFRALLIAFFAIGVGASAQQPINATNITFGTLAPARIADGALTSAKLGGDVTSFGKTLIQRVDAAAARASLGLVIGTDVQAYNANTTTLGNGATGSGNLVRATSPTLTTPNIGAATAASVNNVAVTPAASAATLTIGSGKTVSLPNSLTISGTDGSTLAIGSGGTLGTMAYASTSGYVTTGTANTLLAGKLGNVLADTTVVTWGSVADGQYLRRSGTNLVGDSAAAVTSVTLSELAGIAASSNTGRVLRITDLGNVGSVFVVSNGSNWVPWGGQQMIWISAPNSTLSGTTTEDEHTSVAPTMPAGLLTSRGAIDVRAWVDFSANVSGNAVRIKANGTNVYSVNTTQQFNSAAILIANDNSTTAQFAPAIPTLTSGGSSGAETALSINTGTTAIAITVHTQVADGGTSRTVKRVEAWWRDR